MLPQREAYRSSNGVVAQTYFLCRACLPIAYTASAMGILAAGQAHFKRSRYIMALANQCFVGT